MWKKLISVLLLAVMLITAAACGKTEETTTAVPTPDSESDGRDGRDGPAVYVFEDNFDGALKGRIGYELSNEKASSSEERILSFAGQEYKLTLYNREVTRIFDGSFTLSDDGVERSGKVLRTYETYKGGDEYVTVRAGYTKGGTPVFAEMSGQNVVYLEQTEKQLRDLAERWLSQIFRMNTEGMEYSIESVMPTERLDGYLEGANSYQFSFRQKVGIFMTRTASVSFSSDRVILLVRNYPLDRYEDALKTIGSEKLYSTARKAINSALLKSSFIVKDLKFEEADQPCFDVCDGFAYIEFFANVQYMKGSVKKSEIVSGIVALDGLTEE